jgi:hypothetical protein
MVDIAKATRHILDNYRFNANAFYGQAENLSLGVGLLYDGLRFPLFDEIDRVFDTVEGLVYVLTHECDVDQTNERHFNEYVLVCPINRFEIFASDFCATYSEGALYGMLPHIARDDVFRVFYFPPIPDTLPYGGLLYLNQICNTHVSEFVSTEAKKVCALSSYALQFVDLKLENHLRRPKAENLPRLM